jgi:hypothetical protein
VLVHYDAITLYSPPQVLVLHLKRSSSYSPDPGLTLRLSFWKAREYSEHDNWEPDEELP